MDTTPGVQFLTATVTTQGEQVRASVTNMAGVLVDEGTFPMNAPIKELNGLNLGDTRNVSFLSDDGRPLSAESFLRHYVAMTIPGILRPGMDSN